MQASGFLKAASSDFEPRYGVVYMPVIEAYTLAFSQAFWCDLKCTDEYSWKFKRSQKFPCFSIAHSVA
jgi:hypothetical protein